MSAILGHEMIQSRRVFIRLAAAAAAWPATRHVARAQTYPTRLVRIVVGFPPGGSVDIVARFTSVRLSLEQIQLVRGYRH